jgi:signal transduction histidine kinase
MVKSLLTSRTEALVSILIWTKFATKSDTASGLGLALHIKSIVETYGGRIWAESSSDCK